jgi:hypothetical protein
MEALLASGYTDICMRRGQICAVKQFNFTTAAVVGHDAIGYLRRYCYEHRAEAQAALATWAGDGQRAAAIMSLIQSAKLNGHDPYAYLKDVFLRLPTQPHRRTAAASLAAQLTTCSRSPPNARPSSRCVRRVLTSEQQRTQLFARSTCSDVR